MNSNRKGKAGERDAAHELNRTFPGIAVRRGQQYHGGPDSPDVVGLPGCHVEVKRCERLDLCAALKQAAHDAGEAVPLLLHRRNRTPWLAVVRLADLPRLANLIATLNPPEPPALPHPSHRLSFAPWRGV